MNRAQPRQDTEAPTLLASIEETLVRSHGVLIGGAKLISVLGYPSPEAFRQAIRRGTMPVPVFPLANRRGRFALAKDVAIWLTESRAKASPMRSIA